MSKLTKSEKAVAVAAFDAEKAKVSKGKAAPVVIKAKKRKPENDDTEKVQSVKKGKGKKGKMPKGEKVSKPAVKDTNVKNSYGIPVVTRLAPGWDDGRFASVKIFGHSLTALLRAMGKKEYTASEARNVMDALNLQAVRMGQIRDKIARCENGKAAELKKDEWAKIKKLSEIESDGE